MEARRLTKPREDFQGYIRKHTFCFFVRSYGVTCTFTSFAFDSSWSIPLYRGGSRLNICMGHK